MPKELTHFFLAREAFNSLETCALKTILSDRYHTYIAGSVMVDTPLYHVAGKKSARLSQQCSLYHDTEQNSFAPVGNIIGHHGQNYTYKEAIALSMGMLSHICADITFHPFVYYFTGKNHFPAHAEFETLMDIYHITSGCIKMTPLAYHVSKGATDQQGYAAMLSYFFNAPPEALHAALTRHLLLQKIFMLRGSHLLLTWLSNLPGISLQKEIALSYPLHQATFATQYFGKRFLYAHPVTGDPLFRSVADIRQVYLNKVNALFKELNTLIDRPDDVATYLKEAQGENLATGLFGVKTAKMQFFATQ